MVGSGGNSGYDRGNLLFPVLSGAGDRTGGDGRRLSEITGTVAGDGGARTVHLGGVARTYTFGLSRVERASELRLSDHGGRDRTRERGLRAGPDRAAFGSVAGAAGSHAGSPGDGGGRLCTEGRRSGGTGKAAGNSLRRIRVAGPHAPTARRRTEAGAAAG